MRGNHLLWMVIGCVFPFLLIFLLPLLGVPQGATTVVFFVLMLGCHLMMMRGHGGHSHDGHDNDKRGTS